MKVAKNFEKRVKEYSKSLKKYQTTNSYELRLMK